MVAFRLWRSKAGYVGKPLAFLWSVWSSNFKCFTISSLDSFYPAHSSMYYMGCQLDVNLPTLTSPYDHLAECVRWTIQVSNARWTDENWDCESRPSRASWWRSQASRASCQLWLLWLPRKVIHSDNWQKSIVDLTIFHILIIWERRQLTELWLLSEQARYN